MGLTVVCDENLAVTPMLEALCDDLRRLPGRAISPADLIGADALLVRSVTPVNDALVTGSDLKFVGTATAGLDHIDQNALRRAGIPFASAPGSNANAVVEYVLSALARLGKLSGVVAGGTVGVVGYGQVGMRLAKTLDALGAQVRVWDPLVSVPEPWRATSLAEVLSCSVVSLHAALHEEAPWPSREMIDETVTADLAPGGILVNAGRGGLVSSTALARLAAKDWLLVLDTWPEEPHIRGELLARTAIATPHIAGYSLDAKVRATDHLVEAMATALSLASPQGGVQEPEEGENDVLAGALPEDPVEGLSKLLLRACDVAADDRALRAMAQPDVGGEDFDRLRRDYPLRRELRGRTWRLDRGSPPGWSSLAEALGLRFESPDCVK